MPNICRTLDKSGLFKTLSLSLFDFLGKLTVHLPLIHLLNPAWERFHNLLTFL